jgi:hypothetical protein
LGIEPIQALTPQAKGARGTGVSNPSGSLDVRRAAGLHDDDARFELANSREKTWPTHLGPMQCNSTTAGTVKLKYTLGQVDTQNVDLHDESPCSG